ncbi:MULTISPECIES: hypothetical protein [Chitinophagaceae]
MIKFIKLKKLFFILWLLLVSTRLLAQQAYVFSGVTSKVSFHGMLMQILMDNDNTVDTTKFQFTTELTNIYSSKRMKIVKCINMPMFIEFDKDKIVNGQFNAYFLIIVSDSVYSIVNYKDDDVNNALRILLQKKDKDSENKFMKLPHYTLLDLMNNKKILYQYENKEYNYLQVTKRLNKTCYETYQKDNNSHASYFFDYKKGLYKIDYHWERISDYEIIITKDKEVLSSNAVDKVR